MTQQHRQTTPEDASGMDSEEVAFHHRSGFLSFGEAWKILVEDRSLDEQVAYDMLVVPLEEGDD